MVGFASELWVASPDSAMTIFATMPSGAPGIHRAREDISLLTFGDGWLSTSSSSSPPTLCTFSSSTSPLATDCIYIGTSTSTLRATQWLNPFIPLHAALSLETTCVPSWFGTAQQSSEPAKARPADFGSEPAKARSGSEPAKARSASPAQKPFPGKEKASVLLQYRTWLQKRADLFGFLAPLSGKRLVCNCGDRQTCHGNVLIELWEDICRETDEKYTDTDSSDAPWDTHTTTTTPHTSQPTDQPTARQPNQPTNSPTDDENKTETNTPTNFHVTSPATHPGPTLRPLSARCRAAAIGRFSQELPC